MKTMHEGWRRASRNSRRTREAPTPAYISTKSDPLAKRNGTPASPAIERARSVLPVPGRADKQDALRDAPADGRESFGLAQEIDDFFDFVLGLVDAGDVLERDDVIAVLGDACAAGDGRDAARRGPIDGKGEEREEGGDRGGRAPAERARLAAPESRRRERRGGRDR